MDSMDKKESRYGCHTYCPDSGVNHDAGSVFVDDTDGI